MMAWDGETSNSWKARAEKAEASLVEAMDCLRPFAKAHRKPTQIHGRDFRKETVRGVAIEAFRRASDVHSRLLEGVLGEGGSAEARNPEQLAASALTDAELIAEQGRVEKLWDSMHEPDEDGELFEGHGGSPGEWMVERLDEIATEQARRLPPSGVRDETDTLSRGSET